MEFRAKADADAAIAGEIRAELAKGNGMAGVAAVAQRRGFAVTTEEIEQGWAEVNNGELTSLELELVSAGDSGSVSDKGRQVTATP